MIEWAVSKLGAGTEELIVTVLQEHEDMFKVTLGLNRIFGQRARVVVLPKPTASQSETVARTLEAVDFTGPFIVKDSDNVFGIADLVRPYNYVCVDTLNNHDEINPRNKSYVAADGTGRINNIREKRVISDLFSVGGYFFTSAAEFLTAYRHLSREQTGVVGEIYVSDVIGHLIGKGVPFYAEMVAGYRDWGTISEWRKFLHESLCVVVALDGFVFERGHEHFEPSFEQVRPIQAGIDCIKSLIARGSRVVYLSVRPQRLADTTKSQLEAVGLPGGPIVFDCPNARWKFVTAPHPVLPLAAFSGIEADPELPGALEKIVGA
jgi:hypothetical protein